jgi:hypothetical protein
MRRGVSPVRATQWLLSFGTPRSLKSNSRPCGNQAPGSPAPPPIPATSTGCVPRQVRLQFEPGASSVVAAEEWGGLTGMMIAEGVDRRQRCEHA